MVGIWDLDLVTLHVLTLLEKSQSLSKTAVELGVTQQAVSARVHRIEAQLGLELVYSTSRGTSLTQNGLVVVGWSRQLLDKAAVLAQELESLTADGEHRLVLAASLTVAEYLVPRWLQELRNQVEAQHEGAQAAPLDLRLAAMNSRDVIRAVEADRVQIGFIETPEIPPGLEHLEVGQDRLAIVTNPAHVWARAGRAVTFDDLASTPLICREPGSGTRQALEIALRSHGDGAELCTPAAELPTTAAVLMSASLPGGAPAVVSHRAVIDAIALGRLVEIPLDGPQLLRPLTAIWQHNAVATSPLIGRLLQVIAALPDRDG